MIGIVKKHFGLGLIILLLGLGFAPKTYAASLQSISDTISTSRPSASAPLNTDQTANATQISVVDNGSFYLASDSAIFQADTGQTQNIINVASMSAQISGTPNTRNVYFTSAITNTHHKGTAIVANVTATHTIKFTTISNVPSGGHIIITFPGSGSNIASPSATGFSFNGMTTSNPSDVKYNGVTCSSVAVTGSNQIDCTTSGSVSGGTAVTVLVGCTAGTTACTTAAPRLINPTKSAVAGTADVWKISVKTQDASAIDLDTGSAKIGTIEAVQVQATVEPTITFTIAGLLTTDNYQTIAGGTYCGSETTDTGIATSATNVNLGLVSNAGINHAGQLLTVSTNGSAGYVITATSSGHLINPASGFWIPDANGGNGLTANDTPIPAAITAGTAAFGISPCGVDVPTSSPNWGGTNKTVASGALFSNPWNTGTNAYYATIASYTAGPVTSDKTLVRYATTVSGSTPAGIYTTIYTYVATATF